MAYAYARRLPATDTLGSRIRVRYQGRVETVAYSYTESDPFVAAVRSVAGTNAQITMDGTTANGYRYIVEETQNG